MTRVRLVAQAALATILGASALSPVFADDGWIWPVIGAVLVVAAINEVCRRTPFIGAVGPLAAAAGVLVYVTMLDARDLAYGGVIPTGSSLRALADITRTGFTDIRSLATPVPAHRGLVLLAVIGLAAVELVVDLLAVTLRRAAVAGLPLLAVFALCTAVAHHGVGWIPFVLGATGYLWLLLVDAKDRVRRWGRTLGADTENRPRISMTEGDTPSPLSALGRRVGVTAIAIGVVVPLAIPGLHGGVPKHGGNGLGNGSGSSKVVTINPIVDIGRQLNSVQAIPVLRMTSSDPAPGYLRLTSLDRFDGSTFSPSDLHAPSSSRVSDGIEAPKVSGPGVTTSVDITTLSAHWLPVPMQVENVKLSGDWHYDVASDTVFSARRTTAHLSYQVDSVRYEPPADALDAVTDVAPSQYTRYLQLPSLPKGVVALAASITANAHTPFRRALAIQNYLTSAPFSYSTDVPPLDSTDALAQFLLTTKRGFCQQYAASMAVLARLVGIPARVAVGFTHGDKQEDGSWLVTTHDAHAWPELYLQGYGWLPFEPTPRGDGQAIAPAFAHASALTPDNVDTPTKAKKADPGAGQQNLAQRKESQHDGGDAVPPAQAAPHHRASGPWWLLLLVVAAALATPATLRAFGRLRRRRVVRSSTAPALVVHAAWSELRAAAIDAGCEWRDGATPRAAARLLVADAALDEPGQAALIRLVHAEERARYAPRADAVDGPELWRAVRAVRRRLATAHGWSGRLAAVVWPRSTVRSLRSGLARVADLLDYGDAAGARLRRWVSGRVPRPASP